MDLVQVTQWHKCEDDRDRIYAVLSLAVDARGIKPDYSLSTIQVFQELAVVYMNRQQLRFLKCCEMGSGRRAGPSWIPDWTGERMPSKVHRFNDHSVASFVRQQVIQPAEGFIRVTAARVGTVVDVDVVSFPEMTYGAICREIVRLLPADIESSLYKMGCSLLEAFSGALLEKDFKPWVPGPSHTEYPFLKPQQGADALRFCLPCKDSPGLPVDRKFLVYA